MDAGIDYKKIHSKKESFAVRILLRPDKSFLMSARVLCLRDGVQQSRIMINVLNLGQFTSTADTTNPKMMMKSTAATQMHLVRTTT